MADVASTPLVGRGQEMSRIGRLISDAAAGTGGMLILVGEPGAGKTRLVEAATAAAVRTGMAVHAGNAAEHAAERTLGVALDAFDMRLDQLIGPQHATSFVLAARATAAATFLMMDRLLEVLERQCADGPVLLVLEDLHWSDTASLIWLGAVGARVAALPLAVLATTRPLLVGSAAAHRITKLAVPQLLLTPLGAEQVQQLATGVLGHAPDAATIATLEATHGNPLLVLAVLEEGSPVVGNPLAFRLTELDPATLRTVQSAAVLGNRVSATDLAAMLQVRAGDMLDHLETAVAAGVLAPERNRFAFRHELYRRAVLETLPGAARSLLHLRAARALARTGASAVEVAEHYAQGAGAPNDEATHWLQQAACDLVATAPAAALRLITVAIGLAGSPPPKELLLVQVQALAGTGRTAQARLLAHSLLREGLDTSTEAVLRRELALVAVMQREAPECITQMRRYAELAASPAARARVHGELAFAHFFAVDYPRAGKAAERARSGGRRHGDLVAQIAGESVLCLLDLFGNRTGRAIRRAEAIVGWAELPHGAEAHVFQPWFVASLVWLETDQLERLLATARRGREVAVERGAGWAIPGYDALTAFGALRFGALDDAAAAATAALGYADGVDGLGVAVWCTAFLAQVSLHHGDLDGAERYVTAGETRLDLDRSLLGLEQFALARAGLYERRGDIEAALASLRQAWEQFRGIGVLSALPAVALPLVRLAAGAGDRALLDEAATVLAAGAEQSGTTSVRVVAELAAAWRDGDADRALGAVSLAEGTPRPTLTATALADGSALLRARGRRREADRLARTAATHWAALGAYADAEICLPGRRSLRPTGHRPATGIAALTTTERRVTILVSAGHSNPAIADMMGVSRRTVESHVAAAFRKLGVSSRVALTRAAIAQGLATSA